MKVNCSRSRGSGLAWLDHYLENKLEKIGKSELLLSRLLFKTHFLTDFCIIKNSLVFIAFFRRSFRLEEDKTPFKV